MINISTINSIRGGPYEDFRNASKDDLMDLERGKFMELTKKELLRVCYAMLSCLIDLKD